MSKFIILISLLFLLKPVSAAVIDARLIDPNDNTVSTLYYDVNSHTYKDAMAGLNPDVGIEIKGESVSDVENKYVGVLFAINTTNASYSSYTLITKWMGSSTPYHALAQTGSAYACDSYYCAKVDPVDISFIDVLVEDDYGIPTGYAAYPGRIWVVVSDNESIEEGDKFIFVDQTKGYLKGSFSYSTSASNYDQYTGNYTFDITSVTVYKSETSSQEMDSNYADREYIAVGICQDPEGEQCNGTAKTSRDAGSIQLYTGVVKPDDQSIHTKYIVVNGLATSFCIGSDLQGRYSLSASSVYYGQTLTIQYRAYNNHNVNVTTDFNLSLFIDDQLVDSVIVTEDLTPGSYSSWNTYNWVANVPSGTHYIKVAADLNDDVAECNEANNNATTSVTVKKVYTPYVYINGTYPANFTRAGVPANVSIFLNDSDGNVVAQATIRIYQENGVNLFAPVQNWTDNYGKTGLKVVEYAEVRTNSSGWVEFTLIPTYNPIYSQYPEYELDTYIGNYSLYLKAWDSSGNPLIFVRNGQTTYTWDLYINNKTYDSTGFSNSENVIHQTNYVQQVVDWAYEIYSIIKAFLESL